MESQGSAWVPTGRGSGGRGRGFQRVLMARPGPSEPQPSTSGNVSEFVASTEGLALEDSSASLSNASLDVNVSICKDEPVNDMVGVEGDKCRCILNFAKLTRTTVVPVMQYHVAFEPPLESTKMKKVVLRQLEDVIGRVSVFDGHTLFLPHKLPGEVHLIPCVHPSSKATIIYARLKFVKEKTKTEDLLLFYNTLLHRVLHQLGYLEIKRGFFKISEVKKVPRERIQVWPGVYLSAEQRDGGLMVMMESPSRVLKMDTLYDFYKGLKDSDRTDENVKEIFQNYIIGKIVLCHYNNLCYKIDGIDWDLNPLCSFTYRDKEITYKEYYKTQYNVTINDDRQPMVLSRIRPRNVVHPNPPIETVRVIALVPELCHVTGLTSEQRSNNKLMTEISTVTRLSPRLRLSAMGALMKEIAESKITQDMLASWGLKLDEELQDTVGRRIKNPALMFHSSGEAKMVPANFSREAARSCYKPVPVTKYFVFHAMQDLHQANQFMVEYSEACSNVGIRLRTNGLAVPVDPKREKLTPSLFVKALEDKLKENEDVQFVVVVMPVYREDFYRAVKKFCLTMHPIPSQCVLARNLRGRSLKTIVRNICLQINCKLGGSLWGLKLNLMNKVMVLGMDVAHDVQRKHPSVVAFVGTLNAECTTYFTRCTYQPIHQETCTGLRIIFKDALEAYRNNNAGDLPNRILFYRDGGSVGSFETLKKYEVDTCMEVLNEITAETKRTINFSYLCVAKRIPERVLLRAEGKNVINPPPGTVVDTSITHPFRYDFYIVSQQVHHGTVNPTHYTVLYETKQTEPDIMQRVSYALTYMYYNFPGSIKVPAVIQYAHKLGHLVHRTQTLPNRVLSNNLYFL